MPQSFEVRMYRRCKISSIHRRAEVFLHLSHTCRNWKLIVRTHPLLRCLDVLGTHDAATHSIYTQRYSQVSTAKTLENLAFCCSGHEEARKSCMSYKSNKCMQNDSQHSVNTQSTLQSTLQSALPKCWKIQHFAVLDIKKLKKLLFSFETSELWNLLVFPGFW